MHRLAERTNVMPNFKPIDWNRPVFRADSGAMLEAKGVFGTGERAFRGFEDPSQRERGWIYYNQDGSPFCGAPSIKNDQWQGEPVAYRIV